MINGFVGGLIIAYILKTFWNIDVMMIDVVKQTFEYSLTIEQYFVGFGVAGIIEEFFRKVMVKQQYV